MLKSTAGLKPTFLQTFCQKIDEYLAIRDNFRERIGWHKMVVDLLAFVLQNFTYRAQDTRQGFLAPANASLTEKTPCADVVDYFFKKNSGIVYQIVQQFFSMLVTIYHTVRKAINPAKEFDRMRKQLQNGFVTLVALCRHKTEFMFGHRPYSLFPLFLAPIFKVPH